MTDNKTWRFCVVGNIVSQHIDEDGKVLYGTKVFSGGTKVYINDRSYNLGNGYASVIGLNRFHRYTFKLVPIELIENVRVQQVYKPAVLEIMERLEALEGSVWRGRTAEDKRAVNDFVEKWNEYI